MQLFTVMTPVDTDITGVFKYYFCIYDIDQKVNGRNSEQNRVYISPLYEDYNSCRNDAADKRNEIRKA